MTRMARLAVCVALVLFWGMPVAAQTTLPDFWISDFGVAPDGSLTAVLHNSGGFAENYNFEVNLYSTVSGVKLRRIVGRDLDPAMSLRTGPAELRFTVRKTLTPAGTAGFALVIDDGNAIPESDETNNRAEFTATYASNLVIAGVRGQTKREASGTKSVVTIIVRNDGNTSTEWDGVRSVLKAKAPEGEQEFDLGLMKPTDTRTLTAEATLPSLRKPWKLTLGYYGGAGAFVAKSTTSVIPAKSK
jgi:hypothetical protein